MELIDKEKVVAEIERLISNGQTELKESEERKDYESYVALAERIATCINVLSFLDTLEVKEIDTTKVPKHSYFETIYHCGAEPIWKVGDILAVYEFYSDHEGEYVYGEVVGVKNDETHDDWIYTMKSDFGAYEDICEKELISQEAYKKNK